MDGEYLNHQIFVDVILISETVENLREMLTERNRERLNAGIKLLETKSLMFNTDA